VCTVYVTRQHSSIGSHVCTGLTLLGPTLDPIRIRSRVCVCVHVRARVRDATGALSSARLVRISCRVRDVIRSRRGHVTWPVSRLLPVWRAVLTFVGLWPFVAKNVWPSSVIVRHAIVVSCETRVVLVHEMHTMCRCPGRIRRVGLPHKKIRYCGDGARRRSLRRSRSSKVTDLIAFRSAYVTSCQWIIPTYILSHIVSKLLSITGQVFLLSTSNVCLQRTHSGRTPELTTRRFSIKKL